MTYDDWKTTEPPAPDTRCEHGFDGPCPSCDGEPEPPGSVEPVNPDMDTQHRAAFARESEDRRDREVLGQYGGGW